MQEQLGRLMVEAAAGAWSTPAPSSGQIDRETAALLAQVPLFAGLSRRHLGRVGSLATAKRRPANSPLVREGRPGDAFYVILSGSARVELPGRQVPLEAGDFFGEMALLDGKPRSATVTAVTEVLVLMISRTKFVGLLEAEPKVAIAMMATLTRRLRDTHAAMGL